jgi:hypothetical protein
MAPIKFYTITKTHIKTGTVEYPGLYVSSNGDAEFCNENTVEFEFTENPDGCVWTTTDKNKAEDLINDPVEWYNSGLNRPVLKKVNGFTYTVVELSISKG